MNYYKNLYNCSIILTLISFPIRSMEQENVQPYFPEIVEQQEKLNAISDPFEKIKAQHALAQTICNTLTTKIPLVEPLFIQTMQYFFHNSDPVVAVYVFTECLKNAQFPIPREKLLAIAGLQDDKDVAFIVQLSLLQKPKWLLDGIENIASTIFKNTYNKNILPFCFKKLPDTTIINCVENYFTLQILKQLPDQCTKEFHCSSLFFINFFEMPLTKAFANAAGNTIRLLSDFIKKNNIDLSDHIFDGIYGSYYPFIEYANQYQIPAPQILPRAQYTNITWDLFCLYEKGKISLEFIQTFLSQMNDEDRKNTVNRCLFFLTDIYIFAEKPPVFEKVKPEFELLLSRGADPKIVKPHAQRSPLSMALDNNAPELITLFKQYYPNIV